VVTVEAAVNRRTRGGTLARFGAGLGGWAWGLVVLVYLGAAVAAPLLVPYEQAVRVDLRRALEPPGPGEWLGRDELGRSMAARLIWGARSTLTVVTLGVGAGGVVGVALGMVSGLHHGGRFDAAATTLVDAILALPRLLVALLVVGLVGQSTQALVVAVGVASFPSFARLARGATLAVRQREFIVAAVALGATSVRILIRHVLPNVLDVLLPYTSLSLSTGILVVAALGFLGLGPPPPAPEWGSMLSSARSYLWEHPHLLVVPGCAVAVLTVSLSLLSDQFAGTRSRGKAVWIRLAKPETNSGRRGGTDA
jgi:peptide/nickel transport system permease protein